MPSCIQLTDPSECVCPPQNLQSFQSLPEFSGHLVRHLSRLAAHVEDSDPVAVRFMLLESLVVVDSIVKSPESAAAIKNGRNGAIEGESGPLAHDIEESGACERPSGLHHGFLSFPIFGSLFSTVPQYMSRGNDDRRFPFGVVLLPISSQTLPRPQDFWNFLSSCRSCGTL